MQFIKSILALALVASASAFSPALPGLASVRSGNVGLTKLSMADAVKVRINNKVDLDSEKVATMETVETGAKKVYCRCWESGTFPLCDGKHMAHNKETGDNVGPLIVTVPK
eukprot:CAMPEP_0181312342 /NCGR_PEP_ID=MMETSP1101-20121128/13644_1 /TAXON_ID=46948 /ORGANISM="Rhodomonas abbreviata, Strain Caron Lab Isolate" /LENGTH=110 /DNA_ID=CAMNT_0023419183 /DNA_START=9 /DNA_END=341 /DNA_ORIENTATION=+